MKRRKNGLHGKVMEWILVEEAVGRRDRLRRK